MFCIALGIVGFIVFTWALTNDQFDDLKSAAQRNVSRNSGPYIPSRDDDTNG